MFLPFKFREIPARFARSRALLRGRRILSYISVVLILAYFLDFQPTSRKSTFALIPPHHTYNPAEEARLDSIELESPIFQSLRNVTKPVPTEEDSPLIQELQRIKDVDNWRVLGDLSTGNGVSYAGGTYEELTNEASIAFLVQIAESNILMAPRLLSRIWHPGNVYCIHFDSKIPSKLTDFFLGALKSNSKLSNVVIMPSVPITYSGISMLLNTLESMHVLLNVSQKWDYYINLSGSAYPLVSATGIRRLLGKPDVVNTSTSFVHFGGDEQHWNSVSAHRFKWLHFDLSLGFNHNSDEEIVQTKVSHPIIDTDNLKIQIAKGEAWLIAHRTFCDYATHGSAARRLVTLFANMQSTPEHFFQTLAWNHKKLNKTVVKALFHSVVWGRRNGQSGGHPAYLDRQTGDGSYDLWPYALEYSPFFFARKLRVPNSNLLDHIDAQKSGATDKAVNMTAVSNSFMIVEKRFSCLMYKHTTKDRENIPRKLGCHELGRWGSNCGEEDKHCVGRFALPFP